MTHTRAEERSRAVHTAVRSFSRTAGSPAKSLTTTTPWTSGWVWVTVRACWLPWASSSRMGDVSRSWEEALAGYAGPWEAEMLENLNHLFVDDSALANRGSLAEYLEEGHVDPGVLDRIAAWIGESVA